MIAMIPSFDQACRQLLAAFFGKCPNPRLQTASNKTLARLLASEIPLAGKPGGWAGGMVYAIGSHGCGVPNVLNRELEEAFGTTMGTIYKRAAQIRRLLDL